jgi:antitoxin Phd
MHIEYISSIIASNHRSDDMSALNFRNRHGDLIDVPSVTASELKSGLAGVMEQATQLGAVAITKHDAPKAVLVSYAEFEALIAARTPAIDALSAEFDALLARLQTPAAQRGMADAFDAPPQALGGAARVAAAAPTVPRRRKAAR